MKGKATEEKMYCNTNEIAPGAASSKDKINCAVLEDTVLNATGIAR